MKKKLIHGMLLISLSVLLTGCHIKHEWVEATCTEPRTCSTGGETEGEALGHTWVDATCAEPKTCSVCGATEGAALGHTWVDATFKEPKTCSVCGETEGTVKQSYFEENGLAVADAPVACTVDMVIYDEYNPEVHQMVTDCVWEQLDLYSEPAEEEGYQLICLELLGTFQLYYDAAQNVDYNACWKTSFIYDWYTGQQFLSYNMSGDDSFTVNVPLEVDGVSYDVTYAKVNQWEFDDWVVDDNGDAYCNGRSYFTVVFQVPDGYDGLVFAAVPTREYADAVTDEADTETIEDSTVYAADEKYADDTAYFRINKEGMVPERTAAE